MKFKLNWLIFLIVGLLAGGITATTIAYFSFSRQTFLVADKTYLESLPGEKGLSVTERVETQEMSQGSVDRLVIKSKSLNLAVKDVRKSYAEVEKVALKYKGYIVSSNIYSDTPDYPRPLGEIPEEKTGPLSGIIVLKVPVNSFEATVSELKKLGNLKSEAETTEEVTEQHIDLSARLKNLRRQEERYLEILNAAKTVQEMLKVEEQLSRIRGEIEAMQAQLDYLEKSAAMATITLNLSEPSGITEPIAKWGIKDAVIKAIRNFVLVINIIIISIGTILPFVIIACFVWLGLIFWRKRRK